MKKENMKVKESVSFAEEVQAINDVVNYCFLDDEELPDTGYLKYCPYFYDAGLMVSIVMYFIEGVEFEDGEDIYTAIMSDPELVGMVEGLLTTESVKYVRENADKLLEFRKQEVLNNNAAIYEMLLRKSNESTMDKTVQDILDSELERNQAETNAYKSADELSKAQEKEEEYMDEFMKQFTPEEYAELTRKANEENYDVNDIAKAVADVFFQSDEFKQSVIDLDEGKVKEETAEEETKKEETPKKTTRKRRTTKKKTTEDADKVDEVSDDKKE